MGPDLWELYEYGEADDEVAAIIRLAHFGAVPPGVRVITQFEEIITVRLHRGDIPKISGASETAGMSSGDTYFGADLELDEASDEALPSKSAVSTDHRRPDDLAMTGRGIVVGVIDWGFDFRHPDFRKPDGTSRILALWDQRGGKLANSPSPWGYGTVHTRDAINKALGEKDPYAALKYHPADSDTGNGCHGTHVASIAVGTGGEGRPVGIAPEADLVVVHNAPWDNLERGKLGDSVTLLEAIDFISRTAAGRPWVINLSMGRHGEQHDGTTLIEQGLDAAVRSAAGRAICLSAGNYYNKRTHASGQLRPTQSRSLAWIVNEKHASDYNQLEVWYSWQDKFEVAVRSPDGSIVALARLGEKVKLISGGKEIGNLYHRAQEPNTLDHHVTIYLYKTAPAGEWTVTLTGADVIHGHYHAWIEREVSCPKCQSRFKDSDADPSSTTGTICNGRRTIAVGAYDPHDPGHRIGRFSSVGPTRDGRLKPDLCAPGVNVLAARSAQREHPDDTPLSTRMSGTSMAAPHVAGAVALAFQAAVRPLRIEETHNLLLGSTRRVTVEDRDPDRVGIGFLDVVALVDAAGKVDNGQRTFVPVREMRGASPHVPPRAPAQSESIPDVNEGESLRRSGLHPAVETEAEAEAEAEAETETETETRILEHVVTETPDSYPESFALPEAEIADTERTTRRCRCAEHERVHEHTEAYAAEIESATSSYPESFALPESQLAEDEPVHTHTRTPPPELAPVRTPPPAREPVRAAQTCRVLDHFELNHAELQAAHRPILAQIAQEILTRRVTTVRVVGHASQDGTDSRNDTLSRERATTVVSALRTLIDSSRAGASASITFNVDGRGARSPAGRDHAANRRVEVCLPPGPSPVPVPPAATVEARLRALCTASMVLTGNPRAPFIAGALPTGAQSGSLWNYQLRFGSGGELTAQAVMCNVQHRMGTMTHRMPVGVLESVVWKDPVVRHSSGGTIVTLPLRASHLLGSFRTPGGRIAATTHPVWRLESVHDIGTAVVFGYDLSNPASPAPLRNLDDFRRDAGGRTPRVLVVCELVLCQGRRDFEPGGVLEAARVYPIAEIITEGEADIQMAVDLLRPDRSSMPHEWYEAPGVARGTHVPGLYVDRNVGHGLLDIVGALASGRALSAIPGWNTFFDYFDRNPSRRAIRFTGVNPAKVGTRIDTAHRTVIDRGSGNYQASSVMKVARQGEYDNVHIAPQMKAFLPSVTIPIPGLPPLSLPALGPVAVSMAPICAHDCFHMHWRWGRDYTPIQNLGWGARGAYTEAGAPMVAPNQEIVCDTPAGRAGLKYSAHATRQQGGDWAYVMPHGAAYALQLAVQPVELLDRLLTHIPGPIGRLRAPILAAVGAAEDRAWGWIYFILQYTPTMRSPHFAEVVSINDLNALRRL